MPASSLCRAAWSSARAGECAATPLLSFRARTPRAARSASSSSAAVRSPATRAQRGLLVPAMWSRGPHRSSRGSTSARVATTDSSSPCPVCSAWARLHTAATRAASGRVRAPATWAAATSPRLWPTTAEGSTPQERHRAARETITEKRAGWTTSAVFRAGAPGTPRRTSINFHPVNSSRTLAHSYICSRKTAEESTSSSAIPGHCEPWPGKTNTTPSPPVDSR